MMWAAFSQRGKSYIPFLTGKQNAMKYKETVRDFLLPFVRGNHAGTWTYQQDNGSIHTADVNRA